MWIYNLNNGLYFSHTDSGLDLVFLFVSVAIYQIWKPGKV